MQVSARILGQDYGLTAEEMNRVLVKLGFLKGSPGDYSLTEKAMQYAVEKDFHRGTGGYSCYNRYWTTRTFDDSIKEVLDVSAELISEVRDEIATARAARYAAQAAARAQADAEFLAKQAAEKAAREAAEIAAMETEGTYRQMEKSWQDRPYCWRGADCRIWCVQGYTSYKKVVARTPPDGTRRN